MKKEFRSSGVQEFRSSGVQEFRSSGVQEFSVGPIGELQEKKKLRGHVCYRSAFSGGLPELRQLLNF
jgi:hypothetical protein